MLFALVALTHPLWRSEHGRAAPSATAATASRPNVLLIISDDQRYRTMGRMPKTRRFFGKGGRFYPNAIVSSPLCCPSRAQIFSGRYAHNTRVTSNSQALRLQQRRTLHALLHGDGYRTGIYGKFLNGWPRHRRAPYFSSSSTGYGPNRSAKQISAHAEEFLAKRANRFLARAQSKDSQPWYLVLSTHAPHGPHVPAPRFAGAPVGPCRLTAAQRERDLSDKPRRLRRLASSFRKHQLKGPCDIRARQLRQQLSVDRMVGQVTNSLRRYGEVGNTMAIYISDNGYLWGDHGLFKKFAPHLADVKVPMYVRWPGHVRRGSVDRRLVDNVDLAPTIFGATGVAANYPLDGRDLLGQGQHRWLLSELGWTGSGIPAYAALLSRRWHYIEYFRHFKGHRPLARELYSLRRDPSELRNQIPGGKLRRAPKRVRRHVRKLHTRLERLRACEGPACDE